jgi:acetolactate synthase-1/2/3 large subunit
VVRTVAAHLVAILEHSGVDTVFGIPGGLISTVYAALATTKIRVVTAKHESNAVLLAAGYALATGRLGVVLVTAGPGVTNAMTGIASAMKERVPVLVVAGEVPRSAFGRGALQEGSSHEFDAVGTMRSVTKLSLQIVRAESAVATFHRAIETAMTGGPVFLSLPIDVGGAIAETTTVAVGAVITTPDPVACARAFALLASAKRPLLIAGAGARGSKAALRRLAEATGTPVVVTPKGKGVFPDDHPLHLGGIGFGGHESAIAYLRAGIDVVVVCGSSLDDFATSSWSSLLQPTEAFVHIDRDPACFGRAFRTDLCVLGELEPVIDLMLVGAELPHARSQPRITYSTPINSGPFSTFDVMQTLNELAPRDAIFTCDMGEHLAFALHYLRIRPPAEFVTFLGFGAMGSSIPVGIGMALGAKHRRVFVICGDGGFNLAGSELATCVALRAPVTIVLLNDSRLNMCHHGMVDLYGTSNDFSTQTIDFAAIARAYGVAAETICTTSELERALGRPLDGPQLFDLRIDPNVRLGGSQRTAALRQFTENPP